MTAANTTTAIAQKLHYDSSFGSKVSDNCPYVEHPNTQYLKNVFQIHCCIQWQFLHVEQLGGVIELFRS